VAAEGATARGVRLADRSGFCRREVGHRAHKDARAAHHREGDLAGGGRQVDDVVILVLRVDAEVEHLLDLPPEAPLARQQGVVYVQRARDHRPQCLPVGIGVGGVVKRHNGQGEVHCVHVAPGHCRHQKCPVLAIDPLEICLAYGRRKCGAARGLTAHPKHVIEVESPVQLPVVELVAGSDHYLQSGPGHHVVGAAGGEE